MSNFVFDNIYNIAIDLYEKQSFQRQFTLISN